MLWIFLGSVVGAWVVELEHFGKGCDEVVGYMFGAKISEEGMYSSSGDLRVEFLLKTDSGRGPGTFIEN